MTENLNVHGRVIRWLQLWHFHGLVNMLVYCIIFSVRSSLLKSLATMELMCSECYFSGKKRKKGDLVVSEAYPESEFNPSHDAGDGDGRITIQDLLDPLHGKAGYSKLRKRTSQMEKKPMSIQAPLPKPYREKLERKAAYEQSKKDITKWEPLVKRNREAPTVYFDQDVDLGFSTVGAIASEFEPRTEFEKKIASLVHDGKVKEAHEKDGARLLELNKVLFLLRFAILL